MSDPLAAGASGATGDAAAGAGCERESERSGARRYDHHRLDVYSAAIEFARWRRDALRRLTRSSDLADQLTRATTSMVLNIAEGSGEFSAPDRARLFRIARRSATECDAILDLADAFGVESPQRLEQGRALLTRVVAMLTALVRTSRST